MTTSTPAIGYYIHHQGRGHLTRATAIATKLALPVVGFSSLPQPADWPGTWVQLERDDHSAHPRDVDANGVLHWAPMHDAGLRERMGTLASWFTSGRLCGVVVDVSVEVTALARLTGLPTVVMAMPGERHDVAHQLGYQLATTVIAPWPSWATAMLEVPDAVQRKYIPVGAISRSSPFSESARAASDRPHVVVLAGAGGGGMTETQLARAQAQTPGMSWEVIGTQASNELADPAERLRGASVVISHVGQGAVADIAAARVPAVLVPQSRPFNEQHTTARTLAASELPVVIADSFERSDWQELLVSTTKLEGAAWERWNDGGGAERAAQIILRTVRDCADAVADAADALDTHPTPWENVESKGQS